MLSLGDEDTGNGTLLTDDAILRLAPATPNLRVLRLSSCTQLTDATLINVAEHCPRLESLRISAHDKATGKITQKGLKTLRERPEIGNALKEIVLLSQAVSLKGEKEAKALSKAKKGLAVTLGTCPGRYVNGIEVVRKEFDLGCSASGTTTTTARPTLCSSMARCISSATLFSTCVRRKPILHMN
ncbi:hypothetical protein PENSPDRAFT_651015, partial [Peniophora sp. CONT]